MKKILIIFALILLFCLIFFLGKNFYLSAVSRENNSPGSYQADSDPQSPDSFSFAILGDTQSFSPQNPKGATQEAVNQIKNHKPDFLISIGDLVSGCNKNCLEKLQNWQKVASSASVPVYPVMGNHDRTGREKSDKAWQEIFNLPSNGPPGFEELVYSFDYKNSHFIVLNSAKPEEHKISAEQVDWLKNDLKTNQKNNIFVFVHEPFFPVNSKKGESLDKHAKDRDQIWQILDEFNVSAVFSGHEHLNSRRQIDSFIVNSAKNHVYQIIVGNTDTFDHKKPSPGSNIEFYHQGRVFMLVKVKGTEIELQVHSIDGKLLDSFFI
ncbi:MAG: metallophosphoesterase [Patescibacteria group bacterium]